MLLRGLRVLTPLSPQSSVLKRRLPMATGIVQAIVDRQKWLDDLSDAIQPLVSDLFSSGGETGHVVKDLLNGVWLGHPLHPVITDVPVGAWTLTELLDLISAARGDDPGLD